MIYFWNLGRDNSDTIMTRTSSSLTKFYYFEKFFLNIKLESCSVQLRIEERGKLKQKIMKHLNFCEEYVIKIYHFALFSLRAHCILVHVLKELSTIFSKKTLRTFSLNFFHDTTPRRNIMKAGVNFYKLMSHGWFE